MINQIFPNFIRPWLGIVVLIFISIYFIVMFIKSNTCNKKTEQTKYLSVNVPKRNKSNVFKRRLNYTVMFVLFVCIVISASGPSWKKTTFNADQAIVFTLNISENVLRHKNILNRIIDQLHSTPIGFIIYGDSAHVLSPITKDHHALKSYINALTPDVIQYSVSSPEKAHMIANQLLMRSGYVKRRMVMISGAGEFATLSKIKKNANTSAYPIDILHFENMMNSSSDVLQNSSLPISNEYIHNWLKSIQPFSWEDQSIYPLMLAMFIILLRCRRITFFCIILFVFHGHIGEINATSHACKLSKSDQLYNLGNQYLRKKQYKKAVELYKEALALNRSHKDAQHNLKLLNSFNAIKNSGSNYRLLSGSSFHSLNSPQSIISLQSILKKRFMAERHKLTKKKNSSFYEND